MIARPGGHEGRKGNKMSNTRFNKLWEILHQRGFVEFTDHGETSSLSLVPGRYGSNVSLRTGGNCVLCHYSKDRFREILVD